MMKTKTCIKCGEEKELTSFSAEKRNKDGVTNECKSCRCKARAENGLYLKERLRKYKNRSNQSTVTISLTELERLLNQQNCTYCDCELIPNDRTIDHIYALNYYGGVNLAVNLTVCCRSCNTSKGTDHVADFYRRSDKFTDELWKVFARSFGSRLIGRELTELEGRQMARNLIEEADELRRNAERKEVAANG